MSEIRIRRIAVVLGMALLLAGTAPGTVWNVPPYPSIQYAIGLASNGDTVSVWIPQGYQPPYTYYENINFGGKSILVVSRSFLPNGGTGYDSSYEHVIIDGTQSGSVVTMTGSGDAVLKGFTIQHGHTSGYGGGVNCNAGSILKNHILNNYAATGGGSVFRE
jgi:hypothetical protein